MKKRYIALVVMLVVLAAVFCTPASAWWYDDGLPLSGHAKSTVWENLTVENGSLYIGYDGGINPESYTYHFSVPAGTVVRSHLCTDVWSADSCGEINFTFNGCGAGCYSSGSEQSGDNKPFGWYRFGTDGGGCGYATCDTNDNVAGNGCGGNGVWWNVTNIVTQGATNDFVANARPWPEPCIFDGRKRGANLVHVYQNTTTSPETLHIWFNQGMEDGSPITVDIYNVANTSAPIWTLYVCVDCCDSGDTITFNGHEFSWTEYNHWMSINSYNVTDYVLNGHNTVVSTGEDAYHHPFWTLLVGSGNPPPPPKPDLNVTAIDTYVKRDGQTPIDFVANHDYTIEAAIKEIAGVDITQSFNVSFYDGVTEMEKKTIDSLDASDEVVVSFNWTSNVTVGSHTLKVVADTDNDVEEVLEDNNASNVAVTVLPEGTIPDLDITSSDHIAFLPTYEWHAVNNTTTIELNVYNVNTGDSGPYYADLYVGGNLEETQSMPSVNAKSWMKHKTFVYDAPPGSTYAIEVGLRDVTNETNTANNNATKNLKTIGDVTVMNTHEFGNTSSYTGYLSGGATVAMFNVTRVVPENTTLYNLLSSVADVDLGTYAPTYKKAYGIDGLEQDTYNRTYWCVFVNGIPVNDTTERNDLYQLKEGDVAHWDILRYVNSEQELEGEAISFKPRPIMDYPDPFLHGYAGTVWNTTIVYPGSDGGYLARANAIKNNLNQSGVPNENINITTDATLTATEKTNNHLILIGTPLSNGNSIIADINANHTEVGMPAYFQDKGNDAVWLIDDWLDDQAGGCAHKAQYHGVVMACDNPYNNAEPWKDTWKDSNQTIWIASGVTDCYAKYAADMLASGNLNDKGFWNGTRKGTKGCTGDTHSCPCGDVNGDCAVSISDAYAVVSYTIRTSKWAADVNCDCTVSISDAYKIVAYNLNCCSDNS